MFCGFRSIDSIVASDLRRQKMPGFDSQVTNEISIHPFAYTICCLPSPYDRRFCPSQKGSGVEFHPQLVRTTTRHELRRLPYGSTLTIIGPPDSSITIEGWQRSEVDVRAEIQLRADTEADLDLLAAVNTFVLDEDANHLRVMSTGTHDKVYIRSVAKRFPKALLGLPWKIDYRIRVPFVIDLDINAGRGPISISGMEGNIQLSAAESVTNLKLTGNGLWHDWNRHREAGGASEKLARSWCYFSPGRGRYHRRNSNRLQRGL